MECSICGHDFEYSEDRRLVLCSHGSITCSCSGHGYICLHHERELPPVEDRTKGLHLDMLPLPDGWQMVSLCAGRQVLKCTLRKTEMAA